MTSITTSRGITVFALLAAVIILLIGVAEGYTVPAYWLVMVVCLLVATVTFAWPKQASGQRDLAWFVVFLMALGLMGATCIYFWILDPFILPGETQAPSDRTLTLIQTAVVILGVVAAGGASGIAYRAQRTKEAEKEIREAEQRLAWKSELHHRFESLARMLVDTNATVRIAAVYVLDSVADEWTQGGDIGQRDVCIDLLCGYPWVGGVPC